MAKQFADEDEERATRLLQRPRRLATNSDGRNRCTDGGLWRVLSRARMSWRSHCGWIPWGLTLCITMTRSPPLKTHRSRHSWRTRQRLTSYDFIESAPSSTPVVLGACTSPGTSE